MKLKGEAVFNPGEFRTYHAGRLGMQESDLSVPEDVLFAYDRRIFRGASADTGAKQMDWYPYHGRLRIGNSGGGKIAIVHAGIGSSHAAMNVEELVSYGARRIYEVGTAGAIDESLCVGDVVVLEGAFSDEGASKHYYADEDWFATSGKLSRRLMTTFEKRGIPYVTAKAWTTDAPYRETKVKVARYRSKGAAVVNMESSAVFAIGAYRNIETASVQIVSDVVSEKKWEPGFHSETLNRRKREVRRAITEEVVSSTSTKHA